MQCNVEAAGSGSGAVPCYKACPSAQFGQQLITWVFWSSDVISWQITCILYLACALLAVKSGGQMGHFVRGIFITQLFSLDMISVVKMSNCVGVCKTHRLSGMLESSLNQYLLVILYLWINWTIQLNYRSCSSQSQCIHMYIK